MATIQYIREARAQVLTGNAKLVKFLQLLDEAAVLAEEGQLVPNEAEELRVMSLQARSLGEIAGGFVTRLEGVLRVMRSREGV